MFGNVAFHKAKVLRAFSIWDSLENNQILSLEEV